MPSFRVEILVRPRPGVMDPQAEAVDESLTSLGYSHVAVEWVGRQLTLVIEAESDQAAAASARELCDALLVNPSLESYNLSTELLEAELA